MIIFTCFPTQHNLVNRNHAINTQPFALSDPSYPRGCGSMSSMSCVFYRIPLARSTYDRLYIKILDPNVLHIWAQRGTFFTPQHTGNTYDVIYYTSAKYLYFSIWSYVSERTQKTGDLVNLRYVGIAMNVLSPPGVSTRYMEAHSYRGQGTLLVAAFFSVTYG